MMISINKPNLVQQTQLVSGKYETAEERLESSIETLHAVHTQ